MAGEQNQKQRTFDVLPKPDKLISYRHPDGGHLLSQPAFEQLGVGDSRLAETDQGSDFGAAPFCSPPRQPQLEVGGDRDGELLGDLLDEQVIDLGGTSRTALDHGRTPAARRSSAGWRGASSE